MGTKMRVKEIKEARKTEERTFITVMTIAKAKHGNLTLLDFLKFVKDPKLKETVNKIENSPIDITDWDLLLKITNASMLTGEPITEDMPIFKSLPVLTKGLRAFLGADSKIKF